MTTAFDLIDPPVLVGIEYQTIEDFDGRDASRPFAHFRWHDADYWLLGQMRWHNIMSIGDMLLRLPRGRKAYRAGAFIQPRSRPVTFSVGAPRKTQGTVKSRAFVFVGFHPQKVVEMDFVREEHLRIGSLHYGAKLYKITRPPTGQVV